MAEVHLRNMLIAQLECPFPYRHGTQSIILVSITILLHNFPLFGLGGHKIHFGLALLARHD